MPLGSGSGRLSATPTKLAVVSTPTRVGTLHAANKPLLVEELATGSWWESAGIRKDGRRSVVQNHGYEVVSHRNVAVFPQRLLDALCIKGARVSVASSHLDFRALTRGGRRISWDSWYRPLSWGGSPPGLSCCHWVWRGRPSLDNACLTMATDHRSSGRWRWMAKRAACVSGVEAAGQVEAMGVLI